MAYRAHFFVPEVGAHTHSNTHADAVHMYAGLARVIHAGNDSGSSLAFGAG